MSRSKRKTPIFPVADGSMKWWKQKANKKIRRIPADEENPIINKHTDIWGSPSDGKTYRKDINEKDMRK